MEEQSKFKTLINNLTPGQRIGVILVVVIFVLIIIFGIIFIPNNKSAGDTDNSNSGDNFGMAGGDGNLNGGDGDSENGGGDNGGDNDESVDSANNYVDPESTPIAGGDYNDIGTYLPHAMFAEESDYVNARYFVDIYDDENPNIIYIAYSDCDPNAKALADEYLNTIPVDLLSKYTIEYGEFSEDAYCPE